MDRNKRLLHWTARILNSVFALFLLVFFFGEAIVPAVGVGSTAGTVDAGGALSVGDSLGLALLVTMILGFIIAWWWPVVSGIVIVLCAIMIPSAIVFQRPGLDITQILLTGGVFGLFMLTGVLNIVDGVWGNHEGGDVEHAPAP